MATNGITPGPNASATTSVSSILPGNAKNVPVKGGQKQYTGSRQLTTTSNQTSDKALRLSKYAQQAVVTTINNYMGVLQGNFVTRAAMLEKDRIYQREIDSTKEQLRAQQANRSGDAIKMQNVVIPVVMPQVESAHSFMVETFLSSYPIFPVVAAPDMIEQAQQIDAIMTAASEQFQYVRHLQMAFRDGLKYNLMAMEVDWKVLKTWTVENDTSKVPATGKPTQVVYEGNLLKRLDPYNIIVDPRVLPTEVHSKGDFAGYTELLSRVQLENLFLELEPTNTMNADEAFRSGTASVTLTAGDSTSAFYIPQINPQALRDIGFRADNWFAWAGIDTEEKIKQGGSYEVTTMYCRVIPRTLAITGAGANVPQIYKFILINRKVVIYCERKSNAHNYLPIVVGQPIEDGLGYQTKSFADNATPYQFASSSLFNSAILSQRRKVFDRILYDPSRINKADIDKVDPIARIPVKQEAYGKPLNEAIYQVPYEDRGVGELVQLSSLVAQMSDVSTSTNRVQQGQFQKGNKSRKEFETVMDKSDARNRTMCLCMEVSFLQPIKHIMKFNILQYQPPANLWNPQQQQNVNIDPGKLRTIAWQFKIADGVYPVSLIMDQEVVPQLLQTAQAAPQAFAGWDIAGIIMYNLKLGGASWIDQFKIQAPGTTAPGQPQPTPQPLPPVQTPGTA